MITVLAPAPYLAFEVSSGNTYIADGNGLIFALSRNDSSDLIHAGCSTYTDPAVAQANMSLAPVTTVFNADGSITSSYESGLVETTSFNADGSITETFGPPVNKKKTTTFNANGSITESSV